MKQETLTVRLTQQNHKRLAKFCFKTGTTKTKVINKLIKNLPLKDITEFFKPKNKPNEVQTK